MKTLRIVAFRDENTGETGLGLDRMPKNSDTNAVTVAYMLAHDAVEHVNGPAFIGSIDDELEAMGAVWYVRGQHGDISRTASIDPVSAIGGDIGSIFESVDNGAYCSPAPRTRATDEDETFNAILDIAGRYYSDNAAWPAYRRAALARMRMGWRKARARYERHGRFAANNLFRAIESAVAPILRGELFEGQEFTLSFAADGSRAYCEEFYG